MVFDGNNCQIQWILIFGIGSKLEATTQDLQAQLKSKDEAIIELKKSNLAHARRLKRLESLISKDQKWLVDNTAEIDNLEGKFRKLRETEEFDEVFQAEDLE